MLTTAELDRVAELAYIPEHLVGYVAAVSGAEPSLSGAYLYYRKEETIIFVGYPLGDVSGQEKMETSLDKALRETEAGRVSLIMPSLPSSVTGCVQSGSDHYFRLDLDNVPVRAKVDNMVRRASRDLIVTKARTWTGGHGALVSRFLRTREVDDGTRYIFERIPDYVSRSATALVISAQTGDGELAGFDVADFGSGEYAFYMFNFRSTTRYVPGVSDLLLHELVKSAGEHGKRFVNLGLGISDGVTFFKKKWGAVHFLPYHFCLYHHGGRKPAHTLLQRLLGL
jgi:hypothetical protein